MTDPLTLERDLLVAARELISDSERWTQGCNARDRNGAPVPHEHQAAVAWCAAGACRRVSAGTPLLRTVREARNRLDRAVPLGRLGDFNDTHTHAEVLALFDTAVAEIDAEAADSNEAEKSEVPS